MYHYREINLIKLKHYVAHGSQIARSKENHDVSMLYRTLLKILLSFKLIFKTWFSNNSFEYIK